MQNPPAVAHLPTWLSPAQIERQPVCQLKLYLQQSVCQLLVSCLPAMGRY